MPEVYIWSRRDPQAGVPEGLKRCKTCGEVKPATTQFWYRKSAIKFAQPCLECRKKEKGGRFNNGELDKDDHK